MVNPVAMGSDYFAPRALANGDAPLISATPSSGWSAYAASKTVDNSVMRLEQLAKPGVSVTVAPDVFVPHSTLHTISR